MKVLQKIELTNTKFNHNKAYMATLTLDGGEYFILAQWGKIGGKMAKNQKGPYNEEADAEKEFKALVAAKKADGYEEKGTAPADKKDGPPIPIFYPQKAAEAKPAAVEACLDDPNMIAQEKFDGSRYFLKHYGGGEFKLHSRKMSVKDNLPVDKTGNIPHIIAEVKKMKALMKHGTFVLDGEIMWDHGSVISVMGAKPEKAIARQEEIGYVYFVVYDIPYCDGNELFSMPYFQRRQLLQANVKDGKHVRLPKQVTRNKRLFLQNIWDRGGEGIILKDPDGLYQPGERPRGNWIKVKRQLSDEFVVMGFIPGKGKYKGMVGAIVFGQYDSAGKLIEVSQCSGFTDKVRQEITKDPDSFKGRVVEVEFQERTSKEAGRRNVESLRHPRWLRWRDDKNAKECTLPK